MNVSACLVTRGDVDLSEILASLAMTVIDLVFLWDNSSERDMGVYGRYAAIERTTADAIYVQDDDCVLPPESIQAILDAYEPGVLVANMPAPFRAHYSDSCLVGFGAIFDRDLPARAFERYGESQPARPDVVFSALTERKLVDVPYRNLPWATAPYRSYRQPGHSQERYRVLQRARRARDRSPA